LTVAGFFDIFGACWKNKETIFFEYHIGRLVHIHFAWKCLKTAGLETLYRNHGRAMPRGFSFKPGTFGIHQAVFELNKRPVCQPDW
jgi:hypothetical protein